MPEIVLASLEAMIAVPTDISIFLLSMSIYLCSLTRRCGSDRATSCIKRAARVSRTLIVRALEADGDTAAGVRFGHIQHAASAARQPQTGPQRFHAAGVVAQAMLGGIEALEVAGRCFEPGQRQLETHGLGTVLGSAKRDALARGGRAH